MEKRNTISIDLAKSVFQVAIISPKGKILSNKQKTRKQLAIYIAKQPPALIVMESCSGSNYWGRLFQSYGHEVKLIAAQHVKPFVKTNKNDAIDVIAIYEASQRPKMKFVTIKALEQQDIQSIHRTRQRLIDNRTDLTNHARGILAEYGCVFAQSVAKFRNGLAELTEKTEFSDTITTGLLSLIKEWYAELLHLDKAIEKQDKKIKRLAKQSEPAQRLMGICGIGEIISTALIAIVGNQADGFKNGRELAAFLGLTPRQYSSGGKTCLKGITKNGDSYLRKLLVNGAHSVVNVAQRKTDSMSLWIVELSKRMPRNKVCVAVANKLARIAWAILAKNQSYMPIEAPAYSA